MKKIIISFILGFLCSTSLSLAYVYGGTNLSMFGYPQFDKYLSSYNPSRYDVERYVQEAETYVENGNYDKQRITEAQNEAINKANEAVKRFNNQNR